MLRILVANEPVLARETLAQALSALRPALQISVVPPEDLEAAIRRDSPEFIICSRACDLLTTHVARWIILHPDGVVGSLIGARCTWQFAGELPLATILDLVDRAARDIAPYVSTAI